MKFEEKEMILKNGQLCILRSPTGEDAEAMLSYMRKVSTETNFMLRYEDEITTSIDEEIELLSAALNDPKIIMISVFISDKLVANARINLIFPRDKLLHRGELGIALTEEYCNLGLGFILLKELLETAKIAGFEQIELEVDTKNERAIALYKKLGFELYGTRENTFKYRDGCYSHAHLMLKRL